METGECGQEHFVGNKLVFLHYEHGSSHIFAPRTFFARSKRLSPRFQPPEEKMKPNHEIHDIYIGLMLRV